MIFYTLQGPKYKVEIHDDRIKVIGKGFWALIGLKKKDLVISLSELSTFQTTAKSFLGYGKLEFSTFDGQYVHLKFSSNPLMVSKVERYMQKMILKNYNHKASEFGQDEKNPLQKAS